VERKKGDPTGAHSDQGTSQSVLSPTLHTWKSPKILRVEGEQAVLQRKSSESWTRVHQQLPPPLKLDPEVPVSPYEVKAPIASSCDSPGIDLALQRQQGGKWRALAYTDHNSAAPGCAFIAFFPPSLGSCAVRNFIPRGYQPFNPSSSFSPWNSSSGPGRTHCEPAFVIKTMRHKYFTLVMRYLALIYSSKPSAIPALLIIMNYCRTRLHLLLVNLAMLV